MGVTPEPGKLKNSVNLFLIEINVYDISVDDRVIIIASDGVWEFLSNEQVAAMAMKFYNEGLSEQAANTIVRESAE